ncbi:MAG: hypothetical protein HWE15_02905 [Algoriphagus sp.]|uniref:hypothetical protein n=1 Tax=Algoriphagus sp. TaxID=1872435 RepID=UPI0017B04EB3|nr:hypothetical protein [Algoriphagus sp.]NVJ85224.1 hypothetical protein [Algoriphagus sp.]
MAKAQNFYKERISRNNILTVGVGPSFAYLDNGGQYRDFNFEIKPAISVALSKKLSAAFDLRSTLGVQFISSGGNPSTPIRDAWFADFASFTAKGPAFFFDIMPNLNLIPFSNHMHRTRVNLYGGVGLGIMHIMTEQTKSFSPEETPTKHQVTTGYVPVRAGLSYSIGPYSDIAGEGTMLWTFSDNLDGNVGFNRFGDHLFQAQIVYRRYFRPKGLE